MSGFVTKDSGNGVSFDSGMVRDVDTDKVSVIYKRRDNNLGLIAPEF